MRGFLLIGLGSWRLIDPITFFENSGLILENKSGLLNEARGTGGVVLTFGLLIFIGAFNSKLTFTSTITAVLLFYGFAIARIIGFIIDSKIVEKQTHGAIMEVVFGSLALFCLLRFRIGNKLNKK